MWGYTKPRLIEEFSLLVLYYGIAGFFVLVNRKLESRTVFVRLFPLLRKKIVLYGKDLNGILSKKS